MNAATIERLWRTKGPNRNDRTVDREKTCPFLLRVFYRVNGYHDLSDFATRGKEPSSEELQIYTWPDATLREITDLIKDVSPEARERNARLGFRLIYPDKRGHNVLVELGTVHSTKAGFDDRKNLQLNNFHIGDFLDMAIMTQPPRTYKRPLNNSSINNSSKRTKTATKDTAEKPDEEAAQNEEANNNEVCNDNNLENNNNSNEQQPIAEDHTENLTQSNVESELDTKNNNDTSDL